MENTKKIVEKFYQQALTVNTETTPAAVLNEVLADNFVSKGSVDSKSKEQLIGQVGFFWKLIPNLVWEIKELIQEGNKVVVRSQASGNPKGDFMGLATDGSKAFSIMTIDIHHVENGKVVEVYHLEDWGTAMKQLNA